MPPIVFAMAEARCVRGAMLGMGPSFQGLVPLPPTKLLISGVTRDSSGTVLTSCAVRLFRTADDVMMEQVQSDAISGAFQFSAIGLSEAYYVVAYKAGSPDVAGTTVNTLVGA